MLDATKLTPDEIQQYRKQFKDYPEALFNSDKYP